jgi:hypothetical protein
MNTELYQLIVEGAKAEGKRIREACGGVDSPIDARPGENERFMLEVDLDDGEVSLRNFWGSGSTEAVWQGEAVWYHLDPSVSRLALAALLEDSPEIVAAIANDDESDFGPHDKLEAAIQELGTFWVMECEEWFQDSPLTGSETDDELRDIASNNEAPAEVYRAFDDEEALSWLKAKRDEIREEMDEAA